MSPAQSPPPRARVEGVTLVALTAAFLVSCSTPSPPTVAPQRATVTRVDSQGLAMTIAVGVTNPNSVDVTADSATAHVVIGGQYDLGTTTWTHPLTLPAKTTIAVEWPVSVAWRDVFAMSALAASPADIPYTVDGTIAFGGVLSSLHIPFHLSGAITHQQALDAALRSLPSLGGTPQ